MQPDFAAEFDQPLGLFPLPNAVLLPGSTLPLHIHEPRYRLLVRDALADRGLMAMGLLLPGYEAHYHTLIAKVHPVVCVGCIREQVQTADGRYFINLVGVQRATIVDEDRAGDYRRIYVEPLLTQSTGVDADGEFAAAELCRQVLHSPQFSSIPQIYQLRVLATSHAPLEQLVDLMAAALLPADAVEIKQLVLTEPTVLQRAEILLGELQTLGRTLDAQQASHQDWPRVGLLN